MKTNKQTKTTQGIFLNRFDFFPLRKQEDQQGWSSLESLSVHAWCVFLGRRLSLILGCILERQNGKSTTSSVGLQSLLFFPDSTATVHG